MHAVLGGSADLCMQVAEKNFKYHGCKATLRPIVITGSHIPCLQKHLPVSVGSSPSSGSQKPTGALLPTAGGICGSVGNETLPLACQMPRPMMVAFPAGASAAPSAAA